MIIGNHISCMIRLWLTLFVGLCMCLRLLRVVAVGGVSCLSAYGTIALCVFSAISGGFDL